MDMLITVSNQTSVKCDTVKLKNSYLNSSVSGCFSINLFFDTAN